MPWPLHKISEPHETNDVLLLTNHDQDPNVLLPLQGNQILLSLVQERLEDYQSRSRLERGIVTIEILKAWRNQEPPGRFLIAEQGTKPPLFEDVGDKKARAYISKQFRQLTSENHNYFHPQQPLVDQIPSNSLERRTTRIESAESGFLGDGGAARKLYDRTFQRQQLLDAFHRRTTHGNPNGKFESELVLINGPSGTGKTALVLSLEEYVTAQGGFYVLGKFDQFRHQSKPYSALLVAFQTLVQLLQRQGPDYIQHIRSSIQKALGSEIHLLMGAMPYLKDLIGWDGSQEGISQPITVVGEQDGSLSATAAAAAAAGGGEKNKQHFQVAFRRFVQAILDPEHPIVLVLDDLQWADEGSLGLLECLVTASNRGLMVVGTCRGNEVSVEDQLSVALRSLEDHGTQITNIMVSNLSVQALSEMISDVTGMPDDQCQSLAEIIHSQTRGNAFFSSQYLQNLYEEGLLSSQAIEETQSLDDSVRSYDFDKRIVRLLAKRIMQLPPEVQAVLKVAACLGNELRESLLCHAGKVTSSTVLLALSGAEERGLIIYDFNVGVGRFMHDKFQEAAFSLIEERDLFQLQIGRNLRNHLPDKDFKDNLLLVASLMTQGKHEIKGEEEREQLARLCLAAAKKAVRESAFSSATQFVKSGISLLQPRHWRDQYDLSLILYSTGAELAFCNGEHDTVESLSGAVLENARRLEDKIHACSSRILSLDARLEFEAARNLCLDILAENGEHFPRRASRVSIFMDFVATKRVLSGKTADDILNLPPMTSKRALASMSIIHLFYPIVLMSDVKFSPLTAFRLVRLTLQYGMSSMSSVGFGFYGSVLVRSGRIDEGCLYGQLALEISRRYPMKEFESRILVSVWGNIMTEIESLRNCLGPHLQSHQSGMITGDINTSLVALCCHCALRFFVGDPLPSVLEELYHCKGLVHDYSQPSMHMMLDPIIQACLNLMGRGSSNPVLQFSSAGVHGPRMATAPYVAANKMLQWSRQQFEQEARDLVQALKHKEEQEGDVSSEICLLDWKLQKDDADGSLYLVHPSMVHYVHSTVNNVAPGKSDKEDDLLCDKNVLQDEALVLPPDIMVDDGTNQYSEWHFSIVYSDTWKVPILYFTVDECCSGEKNPSLRSKVLEMLKQVHPANSSDATNSWDFVSHAEHPISRVPSLFLHPCQTSERMQTLLTSSTLNNAGCQTSENLLWSWMSMILPTVGFPIPPKIYQQLKCRMTMEKLSRRTQSNPVVFSGEVVDEEKLRLSTTKADMLTYYWSLHLKLHIAVYMNDMQYAAGALARELKKRDLGVMIPYVYKFKMFYEGIIAASFARTSLISRLRARRRLKYLQQSALRCPENNTNKVFLLKAELAASLEQYDRASLEYDRAIKYARKEQYLSEEALAYERLGRLNLARGNAAQAAEYLSSAVRLYDQWGASAKTNQLKDFCRQEQLTINILK